MERKSRRDGRAMYFHSRKMHVFIARPDSGTNRVLKRDENMILYGCPAAGTVSLSVPSLVRLPYSAKSFSSDSTFRTRYPPRFFYCCTLRHPPAMSFERNV